MRVVRGGVREAAARQSQAPAVVTAAADQQVQTTLDLGDAPEQAVPSGLPEMTGAEVLRAELEVLGLDASQHVIRAYVPLLRALGATPARDLMQRRSRSEVLVAGVKVATQTPPIRSGRRVVFLTLDDSTGPADATFFEDAQGPYAATVFGAWLLVVRGELRRTGPRGVSLRATGAWELPVLWDAWADGGLEAVHAAMAATEEPVGFVRDDGPARVPGTVRDDGDDRGPADAQGPEAERAEAARRRLAVAARTGAPPPLEGSPAVDRRAGRSARQTTGPAASRRPPRRGRPTSSRAGAGCWCTPAGSAVALRRRASCRVTTSAPPAGRCSSPRPTPSSAASAGRRRARCGTPAPAARAGDRRDRPVTGSAGHGRRTAITRLVRVDHPPVLAAGSTGCSSSAAPPPAPPRARARPAPPWHRAARDVLDLGGGTGGQAVRLATAGHRVTVVDPSPDALAALARRAAENGVGERLRGVQGDAENLADLVPAGSVDLVLCHGVLEVVDDPAQALVAAREVLRPGGRLSLVVAQRHAAVLARVASGHLRAATHVLTDPDGRWGAGDPLLRRFDLDGRHRPAGGQRLRGARSPRGCGSSPTSSRGPRSPRRAAPRRCCCGWSSWPASSGAFLDVAAQLHVHAVPGGRHA